MFEKLTKKFRGAEDTEDITFKPWGADIKEEAEAPAEPKETEAPREETKSSGVELKVMRPESYDEVGSVADNLLDGCTVVLNVEALDRTAILRMLDFLNGVTYCSDGEIKKVAQNTFIITPHSRVDISDM
ncbi:MAG: cell division protein SepF [Clostridia bacterium]|nr:cell division protein SepF [Clostridia bacterium]